MHMFKDRDMGPRDRSIRNIPVPAGHRHAVPPPPPRHIAQEEEYEEDDSYSNEPPPKLKLPKRRSRMWLWGILVVGLCAVLGLLLSTVFENATITVTPKEVSVGPGQTLLAQPGGPSGTLLYQTITGAQSASTSVPATGTQQVSRVATGIVTIYNTYSTAPQALIATTRLITADGKIYRVKSAVTVPGATKKADGTLTPGSITTSIYADKPGADYNQSATIQLHIAGFQGDPRYDKFVVQTQGAMSNGFIGQEATIAPADLTSAQNALKQRLDQNIRDSASAHVPSGFLEVNGSLALSYSDLNQTPGPNNTVQLSQQVTATLAIVRATDLAAELAKQAAPDYDGAPVDFKDASAVTISLSGSASSTGPLNLRIGGAPVLVWQFDASALKQALLGKKKSDFQSALSPFAKMLQCDAARPCSASIRPFWRATFPSDPSRLNIIVSK